MTTRSEERCTAGEQPKASACAVVDFSELVSAAVLLGQSAINIAQDFVWR